MFSGVVGCLGTGSTETPVYIPTTDTNVYMSLLHFGKVHDTDQTHIAAGFGSPDGMPAGSAVILPYASGWILA